MKKLHRWLIVPAVLAIVAAGLIYVGIIAIETNLPLESIAVGMGILAGGVLLIALGLEGRNVVQSWEMPEPEEPPKADYIIETKPIQDIQEVIDSTEEAEQFSRRATERILIEIDVEDSRDDL